MLFAEIHVNAQVRFTSLQEVWMYADTHNIQLQAANTGKTLADIDVKRSYGALLPTIAANGAFTDNMTIQPTLIPASLFDPNAPADSYREATFGRRYIYNGNMVAQLNLLNTQQWFNVKAARLDHEMATVNIAKTKADLYEQLANAYYSYILLDEAENLSNNNLQTATIVYHLAANKYKEGQISETTINTALINKGKAEKGLDIAQQNKRLQLNNLRQLLNTPDSIFLTEQLKDKDTIMLHGPLTPDPEVTLSGIQLQQARNQWQSSKAAYAPSLSIIYQYSTQIAGDTFLKFTNTNTLPQQYWGLRLSIPVFSGGAVRYQVQKAKMNYALKQKESGNAKLLSEIKDQNLLIAYNSSLSTFLRSKDILTLYQQNDTHAAQQLNEGIISLDGRLKVYADLITNQNEYLQSLSDYLIQQYRLRIRQTILTK